MINRIPINVITIHPIKRRIVLKKGNISKTIPTPAKQANANEISKKMMIAIDLRIYFISLFVAILITKRFCAPMAQHTLCRKQNLVEYTPLFLLK
jgi:hypothetical protein